MALVWTWATDREQKDAETLLTPSLFSASECMRLIAYRRAVRAGFYNDELPASTVIDGLRQMLAARKAS